MKLGHSWLERSGVSERRACDAREKMEAWRRFYNEDPPHSAIGYNVPIALTKHGDAPGPPP